MRKIAFTWALAVVVGMVVLAAPADAQVPHRWKVWSQARAQQASPLLGDWAARHASLTGAAASAESAYYTRVSMVLASVGQELGGRFVTAAIDQTVGNRLVVHVNGPTSTIVSPTLASLDTNGGHVVLVSTRVTAAQLASRANYLMTIVDKKLGPALVTASEIDSMSARNIVGVTGHAGAAHAALPANMKSAAVLVASDLQLENKLGTLACQNCQQDYPKMIGVAIPD